MIKISDGNIESVTPCLQKSPFMRLDVFPFATAYLILFSMSRSAEYHLMTLFAIPLVLLFQLIVFLLSQWSLSFKLFLGYNTVSDISKAKYVFIETAKHMGKNRVEPLLLRVKRNNKALVIADQSFDYNLLFFQFQNLIYGYCHEKKSFEKEIYPNTGTIDSFLKYKGHNKIETIIDCMQKWGLNIFEIPIPLFLDLYTEHITAPFFVFQVMCLFLWSLDDYWYYSAFTLLMLMFFEGMMCRQRQSSLLMLRNMRRPPILLYVFRVGKWEMISSENLVPGDLISLVSSSSSSHSTSASGNRNHRRQQQQQQEIDQDYVIPCDALLIRGSCVMNEAMLTGESVPQIKETLANADISKNQTFATTKVNLNFENNGDLSWRRHVVMGGTNILQHAYSSDGDNNVDNGTNSSNVETDKSQLPPPPDEGCVAMVIRTGFATVQGGLMRKILFATERVNSSDYETMYFIGTLVVFAVLASVVVLYHGLNDPNRNQFKLFLHCIMIVTSVVPPELPMELSLAITNSLSSLAKCLVYCTEPFRLPYAGRLDILCFDKTGTLTKDKMYLKGVVSLNNLVNVEIPEILLDTGSFSALLTKNVNIGNVGGSDVNGSHSNSSSMVLEPVVASQAPSLVTAAMACCHSLVLKYADNINSYIGDPLEMATLEVTGYQFQQSKTNPHDIDIQTNPYNTADTNTSSLLPTLFHSDSGIRLKLKHRFPFNSILKRMSVVVEMSQHKLSATSTSTTSGHFLFTKGAPEVLFILLQDPPKDYKQVYLYHMAKGKRVLAVACKKLSSSLFNTTSSGIVGINNTGKIGNNIGTTSIGGNGNSSNPVDKQLFKSREIMESQLIFLGFLIFDCDLKPDSKSVIRELRESNHRLVMITGDSPFTAADVASQLNMIPSSSAITSTISGGNKVPSTQVLFLQTIGNQGDDDNNKKQQTKLVWRHAQGMDEVELRNDDIVFQPESVKQLSTTASLCITGPALLAIQTNNNNNNKNNNGGDSINNTSSNNILQLICPYIAIFARVSPAQKEIIIRALNDSGAYTLMCGDGTNDVGALKTAHVGVSIVNDPEFENKIAEMTKANKREKKDILAGIGSGSVGTGGSKDRLSRALLELQEQEMDPTIVKLGDASIASPFTSRRTSIDAVMTVLRQGRATLVTTVEVYKILALNCLVSAYMMSALYLQGLKQGDMQMTVNGLLSAGLFFFLSQAKPLQKISVQKPASSVFAFSVIFSIFGQFMVHLISLTATFYLCHYYTASGKNGSVIGTLTAGNIHYRRVVVDGKFQPDLVNAAIYIVCSIMQINNFVINYRGHPFTQSIQENLLLWRSIQVTYIAILVLVGGQFEPLNDLLQLAPFPSADFQAYLIGILAFNFLGTCGIERFALMYE